MSQSYRAAIVCLACCLSLLLRTRCVFAAPPDSPANRSQPITPNPPAPAAFLLEDPLKYTFPTPGNTANTISFLVMSATTPISKVHIDWKEFKDPNGAPLVPGKVTLPEEVTAQGAHAIVALDPKNFVVPGDYHLLFTLTGQNGSNPDAKPVAMALVKVTVTHTAPDINTEELSNITIPLYRHPPWGYADGKAILNLRETSRASGLADLHVSGGTLFEKDTKKLVPEATLQTLSQTVSVLPSGTQEIPLHIVHLGKTGEFTTQFVLNSPGLAASKVIPVKITVTDEVWCPMLDILLGVLGGAAVNFIAEKRRPRLQNAYRLVQLTDVLQQLKAHVTDPLKQEKLATLGDALDSAELKNEQGAFADASRQLDDVEKQLQDFRTAQARQKEDLHTTLATLNQQLVTFLQEDITPAEKVLLNAVQDRVKTVTQELEREEIDQAALDLVPLQAQMLALRKKRLQDEREALNKDFSSLRPSAAGAVLQQMVAEVDELFSGVDTQIATDKLDEAQTSLEQIRAKLEAIRAEIGQGANFMAAAPSVMLPRPAAEAPSVPLLTLATPGPVVSGTDLRFTIANAEALIQPGDSYRWTFSDNPASPSTEAMPLHRFQKAGLYRVGVEVTRGAPAAVILQLESSFVIGAGPVELQKINILRSIRAGEFAVTGVAFVIATFSGLGSLYIDHIFGSLKDYIAAFFWGFGIDFGVRGFTNIMKKITTGGTS